MRFFKFLLTIILSVGVFSAPALTIDDLDNDPHFKTTEEIMDLAHARVNTDCSSKLFSDALHKHHEEINESDTEFKARAWARNVMTGDADILKALLKCPEIKNAKDDETIFFNPIVFKFSEDEDSRTLIINYSTQPKVLKQKLMLATKPSLPSSGPNPKLMDPNDPAKYLTTEPAWYAVMVVQHDSLKEFVGEGKNNTLSMEYLDDHIGAIYPRGYWCTSRSAIANDEDTINQVVRKVVDLEKDTNDYYVAGDINLEWIMYAEIAADVILTVATWGGGALLSGSLKGLRATKIGIRLAKNVNKLKKFKRVQQYTKFSRKIDTLGDYQKALKNLEKARKKGKDVAKYEKELKDIGDKLKRIDPDITEDILKNSDNIAQEIKRTEESLKKVTDVSADIKKQKKALKQAKKAADSDEVKKYNKAVKELENLRDKQESMVSINRIKDPEKKAKAMEKYNKNQQRMKELEESISKMKTESASLNEYAKAKEELDNLQSVEKYMENAKQLEEVLAYHRRLTAWRRPQTGNIFTRNVKKIIPTIKSIRAAKDGAGMMTKAGRVARAGMSSRSAKIGDWLVESTLKHGSRLARLESKLGKMYGAVTVIQILGDMYDRTSTTSSEFTNGIEFKPFCLLSADDLKGQENVVNYGMWLMWTGNSSDQADDDAAFLQAMDFASKFYYQLDEFQDENGAECNVDIYVVRPFIRLDETNIVDPKGELFWLFMNEVPWSTANQFGAQIKDVEDWERTQVKLTEEDPQGKYREKEETEDDNEDYDAEYNLDEIEDDEE